MKPNCIGLIGGAGPLAGTYLLERIFSLCIKKYGCYRDSDFPKVILLSFPFSEMLCPNIDVAKLQAELSACLKQLRSCGASIFGIACNTLHLFLKEEDDLSGLIHMPRILADAVSPEETPLILCTSTSMRFNLHKRFLHCRYLDAQAQRELDCLIDQILKGEDRNMILEQLKKLIAKQELSLIVLGCTELSLFSQELQTANKRVIDPLDLLTNKILEEFYK